MGFFDRLMGRKSAPAPINSRGGWQRVINEPFSGAWQKNQELSREGVLSFHAVFSCVSLIAQDMGKLKLNVLLEQDGALHVIDDKKFGFIKRPNKFQTRQQFYENWMVSKMTYGNTYILKYRDVFGEVIALYILNPALVTPLVDPRGNVFYKISVDSTVGIEEELILPASEIMHDRFNCFYHPLVGLPPIMACGLAAQQGISIQKNSSNFFSNMSRPSGILVAPGPIDEEKASSIRTKWNDNYSAGNYGKTAIMGDGMTYIPMSVPAADAQMIEQLKISAEIVRTAFHIPAFKIGAGAIPGGAKVGDLNEIYYSDCLQGLIEAIENLFEDHFDLASLNYKIEFDLDALIRMDASSRISYLETGVKSMIMSPNEARKKLGLPPVKGGDSPLSQQQNYSLAALARRDEKDDPFSKSAETFESLYKGVFDAEKVYIKGNFVTKSGALWHCDSDHKGEFSHDNFTLAAKSGGKK